MATFKMVRGHGPDVSPGVGDGQGLKCSTVEYTLGAALAVNDVLTGPEIQAGSTIVGVRVQGPAGTVDVGTPADPDYFIDGVVLDGTPVRESATTSYPLTVPRNTTVNITAAAAAGAAGQKITLTVFFLPLNG